MHVKICGIQNPEDAQMGAELGADEIGLHIALFGARSALEIAAAKAIIAATPKTTATVIVTSETDAQKLIETAVETGAAILQLYGNVTAETITRVKENLPSVKVWKVIDVTDETAIDEAKKFESVVDALALDTVNPATGQRGGSGMTHDWNISKKLVAAVSVPVVLAGGLNPDNVVEAIRMVHPYGVDVNSGVTNEDGSKSAEKIKLFIERAKNV